MSAVQSKNPCFTATWNFPEGEGATSELHCVQLLIQCVYDEKTHAFPVQYSVIRRPCDHNIVEIPTTNRRELLSCYGRQTLFSVPSLTRIGYMVDEIVREHFFRPLVEGGSFPIITVGSHPNRTVPSHSSTARVESSSLEGSEYLSTHGLLTTSGDKTSLQEIVPNEANRARIMTWMREQVAAEAPLERAVRQLPLSDRAVVTARSIPYFLAFLDLPPQDPPSELHCLRLVVESVYDARSRTFPIQCILIRRSCRHGRVEIPLTDRTRLFQDKGYHFSEASFTRIGCLVDAVVHDKFFLPLTTGRKLPTKAVENYPCLVSPEKGTEGGRLTYGTGSRVDSLEQIVPSEIDRGIVIAWMEKEIRIFNNPTSKILRELPKTANAPEPSTTRGNLVENRFVVTTLVIIPIALTIVSLICLSRNFQGKLGNPLSKAVRIGVVTPTFVVLFASMALGGFVSISWCRSHKKEEHSHAH